MTVHIFRSSDASAPSLTGQAASLIGVLDACLVNGYGAKASAGWAKEFAAANLGVYRPPTGNRHRLRVDDSGSTHARLSAYETMSGVSDGTGQYPTNSQFSGGLYCLKSDSSDAAERSWVLVASQTAVYFFPASNNNDWLASSGYQYNNGQFFFGDLINLKPGDAYATCIIGGTSVSTSGGQLGSLGRAAGYSVVSGHYLARAFTQIGNSISCGCVALTDPTTQTVMGASGTSYPLYPDPVTGGILLSPLLITEGSDTGARLAMRGFLPGLWAPLHHLPGSHGDVVDGAGDLAGRQFLLANTASGSTNGRLAIEISDTW